MCSEFSYRMYFDKVTWVLVLAFIANVRAGHWKEYDYDNDNYYDNYGCPENEYLNECAPECCPGEYCPRTSRDMTIDQCPQADPDYCNIQRCMCDYGYLRNSNGKCIPPNQCPPIRCPKNEVLAQYPPTCPGESCSEAVLNPATCALKPRIPIRPKPTCVCKKGFFRNCEGRCVPFEQCPTPTCPKGEHLNNCPSKFCPGQYCPISPNSSLTCPPRDECGTPRCDCNYNSRRNWLGFCVPISQCPPFKCKGINEEFVACPPRCPGETCKDYLNNATCPKFHILIAVECKPDCRCKKGYYRNEANQCVLAAKCEPVGCKGDPNAELGCDCGRTCKLYKKNIQCKALCKPGQCKCKRGYVLNESTKRCVLPDQCPPNCDGPNEYYECGGACDNECHNLSTQNKTHCPIVNIRCNDKCYCYDGYARNKNNICVPYVQCEKNCDGPNEYYECGGACDNECHNLSTQNKTHCPIVNKKCNNKCYCYDGYARNKDKICVPYSQCDKAAVCKGDPNAEEGCECGNTCALYKTNFSSLCKPGCVPGQCKCKEGYVLNDYTGKCVLPCQCPEDKKCNKTNEFFSHGFDPCPPQTCKAFLAGWACTQVIREPQTGCRCIDGYLRNDNGDCIPEKQCCKCLPIHHSCIVDI